MYGLSMVFWSHYFETKFTSIKWFIIIWLESPSLMEILHACYVTCDKLQYHTLVVFLSVLRCLASVLWMFSIIIKIHNIQPIHNGSMAFILFITLNNFLCKEHDSKWCFATRLKCSNNLLNSKMNYEDNHRVNM